jgi:type I restriction-modification system DNA methylase subunit
MTGTSSESRGISSRQQKLFEATLAQVRSLGYQGDLLQRNYSFGDWFASETPLREAPAAAFGRTPVAYDSACLALLLSNGKSGKDLVVDYRALGAPLAFEVREDCVIQWKVGRSREATEEYLRISPDALERIFRDNESSWHAQAVLRAKNIGFDLGPRQLDFIDLGLIPALESQIKGKLDHLLREVVRDAARTHEDAVGQTPDLRRLFRLIFRVLAAKVLHDRRVIGFTELPDPANSGLALERVASYYDDSLPLLDSKPTQTLIADKLWNQADFQNLSVEVLAYIYENTLVDESVRQQLGTHSTPYNIARYILHRLPVEEIPVDQRRVLEPCCGHAIFLVSALQRLREILPTDMDSRQRHRYFVKMLKGFEIDAFALEVAKMCLMLADFPNHNGWKLENEDVFLSRDFNSSIQRARIVVCNPPFEDFNKGERGQYPGLRSVKKPAEILYRVLDNLPGSGMLGFVLPHSFIDGAGYRKIRMALAKRYCEMELVSLPDRVFEHSVVETVLLIATRPSSVENSRSRVTLTEVQDGDREKFLSSFAYTRKDTEILTSERAANSLTVTALGEIWERLAEYPKIGEADIHRGVEWKSPFNREKYLSPTPKRGFKRGVSSAAGHFCAFLTPPTEYLCVETEYRKGNAFDLPWDLPKVVMNAVRISRGPWKIAAFADEKGLLFSQNFTCLWPPKGWTVNSFAAVLNGPVVSAFVAAHGIKHMRKNILEEAPLPRLSSFELEAIDRLVEQFVRHASSTKDRHEEVAREILLKIDAQVLRGYNLPPRLERQILELFRDKARPVPFDFREYYPQSFSPYIPLWMYISGNLEICTAKRLIQNAPEITDPALVAVLEEVE